MSPSARRLPPASLSILFVLSVLASPGPAFPGGAAPRERGEVVPAATPAAGGSAGPERPQPAGAPPVQPESTRRMAERLKSIAENADPRLNPFMNRGHVALLEEALRTEGESAAPSILWILAQEMLNAGRTADSIAVLDRMEARMRGAGADTRSQAWTDLRLRQAIANLRRAEDENCVLHHNPLSCLFPIRGSGVHSEKRGSGAAAAILSELIEQNPRNLEARWLLNIAHMTLGEYPGGVDPRWLLEPRLFDSEHDIGRFADVAAQTGLDVDDISGGSILEDFDGDGDLDVMASAMGLQSPLRYFRNESDGTFSDATAAAGLTGLTGGLNIVQTDYDNDGRPDVLVLRGAWMGRGGGYPDSLLRNEGGGTFRDVTEEAGMLAFHPSQTAAWTDYNGDGWLDVFIGNESTPGDPHPCLLYRNNRDGTFTECALEAGVAVVDFVKAVVAGDYNNDGRPDLYLSVLGGPNRLFRNDGPAPSTGDPSGNRACSWYFMEVASSARVIEPIYSFPAWFWDYDNDGWEDLFVSGFKIDSAGDAAADYLGLPHRGEQPRLYHNKGDGTFEDVTKPARLNRLLLSMGSNYGDLDNDGWLDFYVGTGNPDLAMLLPNRAFRNSGGRFFQDVTTSGGLGHLQKGHGVSFGDLDNDGDQDIYHVVGGAFEGDRFRNALFENPGHGNHWIVLKLEGVTSNRPGIGARIKVVVQTPEGERTIHRTVRSGGSFGASPLRQEIGLGDATKILRAEIQWPSGGPPQRVEGLEMDSRYVIREGDGRPTSITLRRFRLGGSGSSAAASTERGRP